MSNQNRNVRFDLGFIRHAPQLLGVFSQVKIFLLEMRKGAASADAEILYMVYW